MYKYKYMNIVLHDYKIYMLKKKIKMKSKKTEKEKQHVY